MGRQVIGALILAQAMGGAAPSDLTGAAVEVCAKKMVQMAAKYGARDLTSQVIGHAQPMADNKVLVRMAVTINYHRKRGIEQRKAIIGCLVDPRGKIEVLEALPK